MNKLLVKFFFSFVLVSFVSAQLLAQHTFTVLGTKGSVTMDGAALKTGAKVTKGTNKQIVVGANAYLGLAHNSGKTLEITKAGTYDIATLDKDMSASQSALASKYAQFLVNEMTAQDGNRYGQQVKTGSVTRSPNSAAPLMLPEKSDVIADEVNLTWYANNASIPADATYRVTISNLYGNQLYTTTTKDQSITINLNDSQFQNTAAFLVSISIEGMPNMKKDERTLIRVKEKDASQYATEIKELNLDNSAMSYMILAQYYEDKGLFANAMEAYKKALSMSDVAEYKSVYEKFLSRNRFSKDAREEAAKSNQ